MSDKLYEKFTNIQTFITKYRKFNLKKKFFTKDEFNKEYTKSGDLIVNTYSREDAKKYGFVQGKNNSWIFLVVLVLIIGGWFWFKKHKKKKHH